MEKYAFSVQHPLQAAVQPKSFVLALHISAQPFVVDCPAANSTDIAILIAADEYESYHRSVEDLDEFSVILHPRKYCCRSIIM